MKLTRAEWFLRKPKGAPTGTCDWGGCDNGAVTWRWNPENPADPYGGRWLPVCGTCRRADIDQEVTA